MIRVHPKKRPHARRAAAAAVVLSAVSLVVSGWSIVTAGSAGAAATRSGDLQVVNPAGGPGSGAPLAEGGSATVFSLKVPAGAACAADGENGGRWHTYMVPSGEDDAAVAFSGNGALVGQSLGSGGTGTFRYNLYSTSTVPVRNQAPNLGDAAIINIPNLSFAVFAAGAIPVGTYTVGIACVDLDLASARDHYWTVGLTVTADDTDPKGIRWEAVAPAATTTTTTPSSTSTTTPSSTTSAPGGSTTTTNTDGSTTTEAVAAPTSTDTSGAFVAGEVLGVGVTSGSPGGGGSLPATGGAVAGFLASAFLLVVLGRVTVLLGRPTTVADPDR